MSDVKFASSVSCMTTDSQTEVLALKMLDIFRCCFPKREVEAILSKHKLQALMSSPRFSEAIWVLNFDWLSDSILNGDWLYFHMWRMLYPKLIGRIAFSTCENITHIEFYLEGLLPKILAIYATNICTAVVDITEEWSSQ